MGTTDVAYLYWTLMCKYDAYIAYLKYIQVNEK